ncbi:MAG: ABC transporter ATP-binding protein [Solirubrobacterales bacterium]
MAELKGITKRFGDLVAVDAVDLSIRSGEIHALVGENGAGKSTLMNVAYGLLKPDRGEVLVEGDAIALGSAAAALDAGIGMVHQHFKLVPSLTVAENIYLGREPMRRMVVDRRAAVRAAEELSERYGLRVSATATVASLTVGERQRAEILRILSHGPKLIVLDEPTAVLAPQEVEDLFAVIRNLRSGGRSAVLVTHKLDEVSAVADRISVMRAGAMVVTVEADSVTEHQVAEMMVGREVRTAERGGRRAPGPVALSLRDVSLGDPDGARLLRDVSFDLHAGEILGVAGVDGNGQTELAEVVAGLRAPTAGEIELFGEPVAALDAAERRRRGLAHVPEDRFDRGSSPTMSIADNLALGQVETSRFQVGPFLRRGRLNAWARDVLDEFDVRGAADPSAQLLSLSGGNMQKVILARELQSRPRLLVAGQPCRGVDVGAIESIHRLLLQRRDEGMAILLISTELSEILTLSDRILVFLRGGVAAELDGREANREEVGRYMVGTAEVLEATA